MHSYLVRRINWSLTVLPALLLLPPSFSTCLLVSSYLHVSLNCDSLVSLQNGEGYSLSFIHLKLKLSLGLRYSSLSNSFFWNKVSWKLWNKPLDLSRILLLLYTDGIWYRNRTLISCRTNKTKQLIRYIGSERLPSTFFLGCRRRRPWRSLNRYCLLKLKQDQITVWHCFNL